MDESKWENIKKVASEELEVYFTKYADNRKIDIPRMKSFMMSYCLRFSLPVPSEDDIDYIIKYYSVGNSFVTCEQFLNLLETLLIIRSN